VLCSTFKAERFTKCAATESPPSAAYGGFVKVPKTQKEKSAKNTKKIEIRKTRKKKSSYNKNKKGDCSFYCKN